MSVGEAGLTFVSVFVAALLAFYLDGLRENRATRRWVREYLGFWRGLLEISEGQGEENEAGVRRIEAALDGWLAADSDTEPAWDDIEAISVATAIQFTPPLLNTGASVLPAELMQQLFTADALGPALGLRSASVTQLFQAEIRPLVLAERAPVEGPDLRAVEMYRREFLGLFEQMREYSELMKGIRAELIRLGF